MSVHGIYVTEIHHGCLVAEMFKRHVGEVEMDAFDKEVGRHKLVDISRVTKHGCVVADTANCRWIVMRQIFGEPVNKAELSELRYFSKLGLLHKLRICVYSARLTSSFIISRHLGCAIRAAC